jgi:uncharacterized protein YeaO (DUF488 family)
MQIRQQVVNLLLIENRSVARHLVAAKTNHVGDAIVVRRHPAHRQILPLEDAFHAGTLPPSRRVRRMAPVAIVVVDPAARDLLRIQSEFGIALAALHVTAGQKPQHRHTAAEAQSREQNTRSLHSSLKQTVTIIKQSHAQHGNPVTAKRVTLKRVYEPPARSDGTRVLVDRLWPRGLSRDRAAVDQWLRDLAPSDNLRKWFHTNREAWSVFRKRYLKELARPESAQALDELYRLANRRKKLTLLFASKDEEQNNAVVLKDLLEGMRKPPTGSGPGGVRAVRDRQAKKLPR